MSKLNRPILTLKKKPTAHPTPPVSKHPKNTAKAASHPPALTSTSKRKKKLPRAAKPAATKHSIETPKIKEPPKTDSNPGRSSDAEAQAQRKERLIAVIRQLEERWPHAFPKRKADIRPWSLHIHLEIHQADPSLPKRTIQHALKLWQRRYQRVYLKKLAKGGPRYDLQGNAKGKVTEREQEEAKRQLADMKLTKPQRHTADASNPVTA